MHTDLQKCPHCCPQCPHVSPPALLFPDLGHDLKPFLLTKLRVHIVKNCHLPTRAPFPSGPSLLHSHSEWDAPSVGQSKAFQVYVHLFPDTPKQFADAHSLSK